MQSDLKRMYGVGLMAAVIFLSSLVSLPVLPRISKELGAGDADIPIVVSAALAFFATALWLPGKASQ